jgi:catechol 2,3-dioxygenase-like lactoylglutathione lyase family enzyme
MIQLIDHINIATEKLTETRDFFVKALGLKEGPRPDVGVQGHWLYAGGRPIVHLQLARGPVSASRESALNHAAFAVGDLDAVAANLDRHGIVYRRIQQPGAPVQQLFLLDPNGVIVELNSPCPSAGELKSSST